MKISFEEIPDEGLVLDISDQSWFPQNEFNRVSTLFAQISLRRVHTRVTMKGSMVCPVELNCDRCLVGFDEKLKSEFSIFFDWLGVRKSANTEEEHGIGKNELDIIELEEPLIDIFATLRQQFYLMLPPKTICGKNCKGLCPQCGENLNLGLCSCSGRDVDNPFAILTKLKDN